MSTAIYGGPRRRVLTFMIKSLAQVSLVASRTSKATTATAHKHPGHRVATLSGLFWREAMGLSRVPAVWDDTPIATLLSVLQRVSGLVRSGRPKAGLMSALRLNPGTAGTCFASLRVLSSAQTRNCCVDSLCLDCLALPVDWQPPFI